MRFLENLTPPFLKKLDKYLLLNRPNLWSTQIHHLLFWGSILNGLLIFAGFWYPVKLNDVPHTEEVSFLTVIPVLIAFLAWVYKMSLHKAEAVFGQTNTSIQNRNVLIYLLGIFFLFSGPVIFGISLNKKIRTLISPEELVQDINTLNTGHTLMFPLPEKDSENVHLYLQNWIDVYFNDPVPYTNQVMSKEECLKWGERNIKSESEKLDYLLKFEKTIIKYNPDPFSLKNDVNLEKLSLSEYGYNPDNYNIIRNISRIAKTYDSYSFFGINDELPKIWSLFLLWAGLILTVFLRTDLRTTIISGVTSFGIVLLSVFVSEMSHYSVRDEILRFFYFLSWIVSAVLAFSSRNTVRFNLVRKVALSLLIVFTPFSVAMFFGPDSGGKNAELAMAYSGIFLGYAAWFLVFNRRMMTFISQPKQE
ncbi:MAG: hypothetical protein K1X92_07690 [Bacteroidia bacterium]|nr:hypothetical protein [Bacteroidia bacterium]